MKPIAIFYHGLISHGTPRTVKPVALAIVDEAMRHLNSSGLLGHCSELFTCFNSDESECDLINSVVPHRANVILHGMDSFAENLTLVELEKWVKDNPDWHVLYFHSKGATHDLVSDYARFVQRWRNCMLRHVIDNWRLCVGALDQGFEAVGCHWMTGQGWDKSQHYFAGNWWWSTSDYLATVPSLFLRERIKTSGIAAAESRYEAEVWIGNASRLPRVKDLSNHSLMSCP